MPPRKALRLAFARVAETLMGLAVSTDAIDRTSAIHAAMLDALDDRRMYLLLDGPDGRTGAMSIDPDLVSGIVEMQTTGRVTAPPDTPRAPTRTDAAIIAPFLNGVLGGFASLMTQDGDTDWAMGYRFGDLMEDRRNLGLALDATDFHLFRMTLSLDDGVRQGGVTLALPHIPEVAQPNRDSDAPTPLDLEPVVMQIQASLHAILHRFSLPYDKIAKLQVGDTLPIPRHAIDTLTLETCDGAIVANVQLGQSRGFRAVRLEADQKADSNAAPINNDTAPAMPEIPEPVGPPIDITPAPELTDLPDIDLSDGLDDLPDLPPLDFDTDLPDLDLGDDLPDLGSMDLPALEDG